MSDKKILTEITNHCENCRSRESCPENECVLYRIEQIVIKRKKKKNRSMKKGD